MMRKLVVVADFLKKTVVTTVQDIRPWLETKANVIGVYDSPKQVDTSQCIDYILVFGGDGLFLATVRQLCGKKIPVLGVNFGKLGFLAELSASEVKETLTQVFAGNYQVKHRMMLQCHIIREQKIVNTLLAVNDGVIRSRQASRMLYCKIAIDSEEVSKCGGDGVIIATPTGSTAYSLSAGGPILSPILSALVITPICPHMLTMRPLVIPASQSVEISFCPPYPGEAVFTVDGQIQLDLQEQDCIRISKAEESFYLVDAGRRSYFKILREKLAWGEGRNVFNR